MSIRRSLSLLLLAVAAPALAVVTLEDPANYAEGDAAGGRKKPALNALKKSARKLTDFSHRLRSLRSRKRIPAETRTALLEEAAPILEDLKALRKQL